MLSNLPNSVYYYTQFIGVPSRSIPQKSLALYPFLHTASDTEECSVLLKDVGSLSLEHVFASMVEYCLSVVKNRFPRASPYPVLSVPSYSSVSYLQNVALSMEIAGVEHYSTLQCSLAAVLSYVYYKNKDRAFEAFSPAKPHTFLLIDVGFFSTECSLFCIWQDHVQRQSFSYRTHCGGDSCTWAILSLLLQSYETQIGPFPSTHSKLLLSYYFQAERIKHDLSLDGVNEVDAFLTDEVTLTLSSRQLEAAIRASGLLEDTVACIRECVRDASFSIDRIECIGSGSRAAYVKEAVREAVSEKGWDPTVSYTLNIDEACAFGCTLFAVYKACREDVSEQALLQSIEALNVPFTQGVDSCVRAPHRVVEEGRRKEAELAQKHREYQQRSATLNHIEEDLITFQHDIDSLALGEKETVSSAVASLLRCLTMKGFTFSLKELECIHGVVRVLINSVNGKEEELEVRRVEAGAECWLKGLFKNGRMNGAGSSLFEDPTNCVKEQYVGDFVDGERSGRGSLVALTPERVAMETGMFRRGCLVEGFRIEYWRGREVVVEAAIRQQQPTAYCVRSKRGAVLYVGGLWKGRKHGYGISFYSQSGGKQYEGMYENGLREGQGTSYTRSGAVQYTGLWHLDEIVTSCACLFPTESDSSFPILCGARIMISIRQFTVLS